MTNTHHQSDAGRQEALRVRQRFERLLAAGVAISTQHAIDAVLRQVVQSACDVVGARYAAIGVLGDDRKTLVRFETAGIAAGEQERIGAVPSGHGLLGVLTREGRPIRIPKISADARRHGFPPDHPPMESFLGVPILGPDRVYGNLYLTEKIGEDEFTDEDERIATLLAAQAAAAIETAHLLQQQSELVSQLQTLQFQRDQFFAMMNHELRNALTGVYGWAEQLHRGRSPGSVERAGREVYESAERTITLLNNLLDLSRLDAGKAQAMFRTVALQDTIRAAVTSVRPTAEAKHVTVEISGGHHPISLRTDPLRLEQILVNLLTNAVRHSPSGETVTVSSDTMSDELVINVTDRGHGIAQEDQPKIFEPYVRVDPESGLGSGLGLPVSRRLAELIGGRLTVSSDLGRGATFTVVLPLGTP